MESLQLLCLTVFNALFLLYAIIQIKEIRDATMNTSVGGTSSIPIDVLTTIIPIVISVAEIAYIGVGWQIYTEFGWKLSKDQYPEKKRICCSLLEHLPPQSSLDR
ncbi:hypothetical protein BYT27DRAFT_7343271 [Phlegmacium glaucopus]|nr:hypothetical protein BYT27DRAFT_7343271 [Phlegmacium glaucopus]